MQNLVTEPIRYRQLSRCFSGLMELYEVNYLYLRRLIPDLDSLGESAVSVVPGAMDLHYQLVEECKFTTTFTLSYRFCSDKGNYQAPDLQIRFYRDARVAEAVSGVLHRQYLHGNGKDGHRYHSSLNINAMLNRWRLNRFLYKWLRFCIKQGHQFVSCRNIAGAATALDEITRCEN